MLSLFLLLFLLLFLFLFVCCCCCFPRTPKEKKSKHQTTLVFQCLLPYYFLLSLYFSLVLFFFVPSLFPLFPSSSFIPSFLFSLSLSLSLSFFPFFFPLFIFSSFLFVVVFLPFFVPLFCCCSYTCCFCCSYVDFCFCWFYVLLLLSLLCCYVVKLGKARKQKKWKYFQVFFTRQVMVACAKVIVFLGGCFVVFLVAQKHYKNSFLRILTC